MYDFKVNLYGKMEVTVVAESKEEAERILNDTIDSITVKDIKDKISRCNEVDIKESNVIKSFYQPTKERGEER